MGNEAMGNNPTTSGCLSPHIPPHSCLPSPLKSFILQALIAYRRHGPPYFLIENGVNVHRSFNFSFPSFTAQHPRRLSSIRGLISLASSTLLLLYSNAEHQIENLHVFPFLQRPLFHPRLPRNPPLQPLRPTPAITHPHNPLNRHPLPRQRPCQRR